MPEVGCGKRPAGYEKIIKTRQKYRGNQQAEIQTDQRCRRLPLPVAIYQ